MKPFNQLTPLGQIRRLQRLAIEALKQYDLHIDRVRFMTIQTNTMFQVRAEDGGKFVFRIYSDEETTLEENQAEMYWLNAIKRDTDLKVSEPIARRDGDYITVIHVPGIPGPRRCVLFKWVPGRSLENHLSSETYFKFGQTLAKLHNHSSQLRPLPPDIQPKKWDKVFYYPGEPVVYNTPEYSHLFPPDRVEIIDQVIEKAEAVFAKMFKDASRQMLIHGDFHFWNVHIYRGELYVLDFEDISLGYPEQDIAISLYYGRDREAYSDWKAAFERGYRSMREWPEQVDETIETLMAARRVNFINYVARIDSSPQEFIETRCEVLAKFLRSSTSG